MAFILFFPLAESSPDDTINVTSDGSYYTVSRQSPASPNQIFSGPLNRSVADGQTLNASGLSMASSTTAEVSSGTVNTSAKDLNMAQIDFNQSIFENQLIISVVTDKEVYSTDDEITLSGTIRISTQPLVSIPVLIEALDGNKTSYSNMTITDTNGRFTTTIPTLDHGVMILKVRVPGTDIGTEAITTIIVDKPQWQVIVGIAAPILAIVSTFVILWSLFPRYDRILIPIAIGLASLAYFVFYMFSPLDPISNAAVIAALLAPLAPYIYETMKNRRDALSGLEESVGKYRNESITKDVKSSLNIQEELTAHQATFKAKNDEISEMRLSKSLYEKTNKVGRMGNLPGLRVNQYYYYVDAYNHFLHNKINREGKLSEEKKYEEFRSHFNKLKVAYSALNNTVYTNVTYNIARLQNNYLSFPTVKFPTRHASPPLLALLQAEILGPVEPKPTTEIQEEGTEDNDEGTQAKDEDIYRIVGEQRIKYNRKNAYDLIKVIKNEKINIYSEENAYKFMEFLRVQFSNNYKKLEKRVNSIHQFENGLISIRCYSQVTLTDQNTSKTIKLKCKDDGDRPLAFGVVSLPMHGTITHINSSRGEVTYAPHEHFVGEDKFIFSATSGIETSNSATVTINVYHKGAPDL
jgi:hypothetical protein